MLTEDIILTMEGVLLKQGGIHVFERCFLFPLNLNSDLTPQAM